MRLKARRRLLRLRCVPVALGSTRASVLVSVAASRCSRKTVAVTAGRSMVRGIGISIPTPPSVPRILNPELPQEPSFETSASSSAPIPRTTFCISPGRGPRNPFNPDSGHTPTRTRRFSTRPPGSRHRSEPGVPRRSPPPLTLRALQMPEDPVDHRMIDDERDDLHLGAA